MPRVILLAGILALLAAAGATTAFRVTEPEVTRHTAVDPLTVNLRHARGEMALP
jgi:hypothetical protein